MNIADNKKLQTQSMSPLSPCYTTSFENKHILHNNNLDNNNNSNSKFVTENKTHLMAILNNTRVSHSAFSPFTNTINNFNSNNNDNNNNNNNNNNRYNNHCLDIDIDIDININIESDSFNENNELIQSNLNSPRTVTLIDSNNINNNHFLLSDNIEDFNILDHTNNTTSNDLDLKSNYKNTLNLINNTKFNHSLTSLNSSLDDKNSVSPFVSRPNTPINFNYKYQSMDSIFSNSEQESSLLLSPLKDKYIFCKKRKLNTNSITGDTLKNIKLIDLYLDLFDYLNLDSNSNLNPNNFTVTFSGYSAKRISLIKFLSLKENIDNEQFNLMLNYLLVSNINIKLKILLKILNLDSKNENLNLNVSITNNFWSLSLNMNFKKQFSNISLNNEIDKGFNLYRVFYIDFIKALSVINTLNNTIFNQKVPSNPKMEEIYLTNFYNTLDELKISNLISNFNIIPLDTKLLTQFISILWITEDPIVCQELIDIF